MSNSFFILQDPIVAKQGFVKEIHFGWEGPDGTLKPLDDFEFSCPLYLHSRAGEILATLTVANGGFVIDGDGRFTMVIDIDTLSLVEIDLEQVKTKFPFANLWFDITAIPPVGDPQPFGIGVIQVFA